MTPSWTSEKPTQPGWYWWRSNKKSEPFIMHLGMTAREIDGPEILCTDNCEDQETPDDLGGEFLGPLEVPR